MRPVAGGAAEVPLRNEPAVASDEDALEPVEFADPLEGLLQPFGVEADLRGSRGPPVAGPVVVAGRNR